MTEPTDALELLATGRFDEWWGLPPLSLRAVTARFPPSDLSPVVGSLGSDLVPARYVTVPVPGFGSEVRVWFTEPDDLVVRIDGTPAGAGLAQEPLVRRLGEPDARLDTYLNVLRVEKGELVYARRGLTLLTNPANQLLLGTAFYAGTTPEVYERRLRLDLRLRTGARPAPGTEEERP